MAEAGKIYSEYTHIEIDEKGQVWLIQNHFESDSVITEMEASAHGHCIIDGEYELATDEYDYYDDEFDDLI